MLAYAWKFVHHLRCFLSLSGIYRGNYQVLFPKINAMGYNIWDCRNDEGRIILSGLPRKILANIFDGQIQPVCPMPFGHSPLARSWMLATPNIQRGTVYGLLTNSVEYLCGYTPSTYRTPFRCVTPRLFQQRGGFCYPYFSSIVLKLKGGA